MKIAEAIKHLTEMSHEEFIAYSKEDFKALKLGIEALERLERARKHGAVGVAVLLPSETPE